MTIAGAVTPLDIATAVVAGYAAIVATLGLGFQVVSWLLGWQTRVEVKLIPGMTVTNPLPGGDSSAVLIKIINHSDHAVQITHIGVLPLCRRGHHIMFPQPRPLPAPGPFAIPPRDAVTVWQPPSSFNGGDPRWKTRAQVTTSDDKTFRSKRVAVGALAAE